MSTGIKRLNIITKHPKHDEVKKTIIFF